MKQRHGFVTNSSSSSFILAFKDKQEAYFTVCESFLSLAREEGLIEEVEKTYNEGYVDFDEHASCLDNIFLAMENNKITKEAAIEYYIEEVTFYPMKFRIREKFLKDEEKYPRKNLHDFAQKYDELIMKELKRELQSLREELNEWFGEKEYITRFSLSSSWPEGKAHDVCKNIDAKYMKTTRD